MKCVAVRIDILLGSKSRVLGCLQTRREAKRTASNSRPVRQQRFVKLFVRSTVHLILSRNAWWILPEMLCVRQGLLAHFSSNILETNRCSSDFQKRVLLSNLFLSLFLYKRPKDGRRDCRPKSQAKKHGPVATPSQPPASPRRTPSSSWLWLCSSLMCSPPSPPRPPRLHTRGRRLRTIASPPPPPSSPPPSAVPSG